MTVERTNVFTGPLIGNGVTVTFPFTFHAASVTEVSVELGGVLVDPSDYTVSLNPDGTGSITFFVAPVGTIFINSDPLFTQEVDFEDQGPFYQSSVNEPIDRSALRDLILADQVGRAPIAPRDRSGVLGKFPVVLPDGSFGWSSGTGADAGLRGDLALDAGPLIYTRQAADLPAFSLQTIFRDGPAVAAHYFRKPSDPDDTLSLKRALATGLPVYLQAGKGTGPNGEFYLDQNDPTGATSLINRNGIRIFGDSKNATIIRPKRASGYALHGTKNTNDPGNNYRGLYFHDLSFVGWVQEEGFQEHTHLLSLSGVTDVSIERCAFVGWRGDAIYFGQGNIGGQEIHNERVTIRDCYFDGVNNNNRNGVSFIDCDTSIIENCTFVRCARPGAPGWTPGTAYDKFTNTSGPGMPGAIDYEPDGNNAKIRNAIVRGCTFWGCSGNVATIGILITNAVPKANCRGFLFEGNFFRQNFVRGAEIFALFVRMAGDPLTPADVGHQVIIRNNQGWGGSDATGPIVLFCAKDVLVQGNRFEDYGAGNLWGYVDDTRSNRLYNCKVKDNQFVRCARTSGSRIINSVFGVDLVTFESNSFEDCGDGTGFAYVWDFNVGTSSYVSILGNTVTSPTGKTSTNAIIKEAAHTFTPGTNRIQGNNLGGKASFFLAAQSDLVQPYTPVVEGGGTVGAGTYTRQYGEYTQAGDWVQGFVNVAMSGHSGVGVIEVAVPIDPADLVGPDWPVSVVLETTGAGVPGAGKQVVGQVHGFASTTVGSGAIRLYTVDPSTGAKAPLNIQNVAYTINISFAYRAQAKP